MFSLSILKQGKEKCKPRLKAKNSCLENCLDERLFILNLVKVPNFEVINLFKTSLFFLRAFFFMSTNWGRVKIARVRVKKKISVQNCHSCKFDPPCKYVFAQFCPLVQICLRAKVSSCNFDTDPL